MLLLVGLGNPTPNSENNRHNIGFKMIDAINKSTKLRALKALKALKTKDSSTDGRINADTVILKVNK